MDFNLKQWRFQQQQQQQQQGDEESAAATPAKIPRLFFDSQIIKEEEDEKNKNGGKTEYSVSPQLHLFVPTDDVKLTSSSLSAYPSDHSTNRFPRMGGGGSNFSYGQWQELELQALIYRHMLAGAAIPPQLLLMLHKSLFNTTSPPATTNSLSSSYYLHPLQHYHPALLQSGYWGKGAMDPEPGRCRRTDGKKWRCSRDVVGGQKYCVRHVHRGRNRSRKPVELPATTTTTTPLSTLGGSNNVPCGNSDATGNLALPQVTLGVSVHFDLTGPSVSSDHFQHAQRPSGAQTENKITSEIENKVSGNLNPGGQALRHFFDDRSNRSSSSSGSSTSLSISTSGNMSSDFSLKLATGNGNESEDRERTQSGWGGAGWGPANQVAPMGGPLAEALRSSRGSNASSTCVLNLVK